MPQKQLTKSETINLLLDKKDFIRDKLFGPFQGSMKCGEVFTVSTDMDLSILCVVENVMMVRDEERLEFIANIRQMEDGATTHDLGYVNFIRWFSGAQKDGCGIYPLNIISVDEVNSIILLHDEEGNFFNFRL